MLFYYTVLISPVLWFLSLYFLRGWGSFKKFFIINTLVLFAYLIIILNGNFIDFPEDVFGMKRLFFATASMMAHIILGFVFSFAIYLKQKRIKAKANR